MTDKEMLHKLVDNLTEEQCSEVIDFIVSEITTQECASCDIGGVQNAEKHS